MEELRNKVTSKNSKETNHTVSLKSFFMFLYINVFYFTDPFINIWMLYRYAWFSNLKSMYFIFIFSVAYLLLRSNQNKTKLNPL